MKTKPFVIGNTERVSRLSSALAMGLSSYVLKGTMVEQNYNNEAILQLEEVQA